VQCRQTDSPRARRPAGPPAGIVTDDDRRQRVKQYWPIRLSSNNVTNLHPLTSHSTTYALQHGYRIVTIDYCVVTSPYVFGAQISVNIKRQTLRGGVYQTVARLSIGCDATKSATPSNSGSSSSPFGSRDMATPIKPEVTARPAPTAAMT